MSLKNFNKKDSRFNAILNQEMIAVQVDPKFIEEAANCIDTILNAFRNDDKLENDKYYKGDGLNNIKKLEAILSKRFGPQFVLGENSGSTAFATITNFGLVKDNKFGYVDYFALIEKFNKDKNKINSFEKDADNYLKDNDVSRLGSEYESYIKIEYLNSLIKLIKQYHNGVKLDLKKAKVLTVPKNLSWYISVDWKFFADKDLTSKELLAIILHETGHHWTYLEYSYKLYGNVQIVADIMLEEYVNKNKTPKEVIEIIYNKAGSKPPIKNPENIQVVLLAAFKDIVRGERIDYKSNYNEVEQQADEFASRFGLQFDLASALSKNPEYKFSDAAISVAASELFSPIGIFFMGLAGCISGALGIGIILPVLAAGAGAFTGIFINAVNNIKSYITRDSNIADSYDLRVDRLKRLRNSAIKRLSYITDRNTKEELLEQISHLDKLINTQELINKSSWKDKVFNFFYGKTDTDYDYMLLVQELLSNKMHVASARINTLIS